ncbi:MAG TPA: PepSY-like domain-containing protein [Agriterribacter sp.]|nr:PepSY-like domain-containing protein [Agriterribacter sp.]
MKRNLFIMAFGLLLAHGRAAAQDIPQSQVPSVVLNHFKQTFPKAFDVEWEIKGNRYCVEFETKLSKDHEACYDNSGRLLRHKEDITKRKLPAAIQSAIKSNFNGYRIDDIKKITTGSTIEYIVELQSLKDDLKVVFDEKGKILKQYAD